jgi:hypothetical protein
MSHKTVTELAQKYSVSVPVGATGKKLIFQELNPANFKIDSDYQRVISRASLKKQGQLDWTLLVPAVVAKRPDSLGEELGGHWVIDGQHKTIKLLQSGEDAPLPCMVYQHDENSSYEDCKKAEAQIFFALNTQRKKLNKIDEIRAGIITGDPESLWIEEVMKTLNVQFDAFGSTQDDAKEIKSFSHFYQACVEAYDKHKKTGSMTGLKRGYDLLLEMYPNDSYITGYAFRSCALIHLFIEDALSNGKRDSFYNFLRYKMPTMVSQERLTKGFTNYNADRYVLHSVIQRYAEFCDATKVKAPYRIGPDTLAGAANVYSRFSDPNIDEDDN